jgi:formyl-CoA transferase
MEPLRGIRVLDFSKVLAGPLCAQYLGDMGADVIKVEPPRKGDDTRAWPPFQGSESATFMAVNHNKRSLAIDLKTAEGQRIAHTLAKKSDVVIQGFGAGTARRLAIDYETLREHNPALVYCEISGYGRSGPLGEEPGYDVMLQAFSGIISTIGQPDGDFARVSFSLVDLGTGVHALSGILAALLHSRQTGEGALVEVSLLDTAMGYMGYLAHNYWASGVPPRRMGTAHPSLCPYQVFETRDGKIMLGVGNDRAWQRFCALAGLEDYRDDPRFATNADRVRHFDETCRLVQDRMRSDTTSSWLRCLRDAGVPAAPIHRLDEALAHEQVQARGIVVESRHPTAGAVRHIAHPVTFNGDARDVKRTPPRLGEHSLEVLREAGCSQEQIAEWVERGVVQVTR